MLGFFFTTVGDVVTRGEGPLEQLVDEEMFIGAHASSVLFHPPRFTLVGLNIRSRTPFN